MANAGFVGGCEEFCTPGCAVRLSGRIHRGLPELKRRERARAAAFAAARRPIGDLSGAADRVVPRVTTRATHRGELSGIAATGREVVIAGIVIDRFRDGKIAESWGELDGTVLFRPLRGMP